MEKKLMIVSLILSLILIPVIFAQDFKISPSKSEYKIGEEVILNIDIINSKPVRTTYVWYIQFSPPIHEYPMTLSDQITLDPHETYSVEQKREAQKLGEYTVSADFFDINSDDQPLESLDFKISVVEKTGTNKFLYIGILAVFVAFIIIFFVIRD